MIPHPLIAAVSGILLLAGLHAIAQDQATDAPAAPLVKIATVDMQELFKQYHRTNEAQKQINVERARIQKDNNERLARIRELETNLGTLKKQIEDPSINDSKKQALFKDLQMQQQEGIVTHFDAIKPQQCPCGNTRRAFAMPENTTTTIHLVDISVDAKTHYHKNLTEIYLILEGEGNMELDGELIPVRPMTTIFIPPASATAPSGK